MPVLSPVESAFPSWMVVIGVLLGVMGLAMLGLYLEARRWWQRLTHQLAAERAAAAEQTQHNQILNSLIEARTAELRQAQDRITRQAQTLEAQQAELHQLEDQLSQAHSDVDRKGSAMRESLEYAHRIQQSLLPTRDSLQEQLPHSFIYFRPRDIVSGDFHWMYPQRRQLYLAVVDCTGHGVPGALMSMIGQTSLNQIVREFGDLTPEHVLGELHLRMLALLRQDFSLEGDHVPPIDGMDIALIRLHWETGLLQFSGAHRPLLLIRQQEVHFVRGSPRSIGGMSRLDDTTGYRLVELQLEPGDQVYLFTDGVSDQFDPQKRKFGTERLCNLLLASRHLNLEEQRAALHQALRDWQGRQPQLDDMLLLGFRWQGPRPVFNLRRRVETELDWVG